ncbi:MAG: MerC domain-containing protein [Halioglobus sp.]
MTDQAAIGLSLLCAIHCLALPVATTALPSLVALGFADESFHVWLVVVVIPLSAFALTMGCRKHRQSRVLFIGVLGLLLLCLGPILGHDVLSETVERALTLIGAALVAAGHVRNFLLCRERDACDCQE